jgi:hypothetical protein
MATADEDRIDTALTPQLRSAMSSQKPATRALVVRATRPIHSMSLTVLPGGHYSLLHVRGFGCESLIFFTYLVG